MRNAIVCLCLIGSLVSTPVPAACLLDDYSVRAEYARSTAIVTGRVVSERSVPDGSAPAGVGGTMYQIAVQESFRGTLHGTVEVFSENSSGRFPMLKGKAYLLFLYRESGVLSADNCGNSGLVSKKKKVLAELRALHP
jgi:hypothetical protein